MILPTFTWPPDYSPQIEETPSILETGFGDNYAQAIGNGLNNLQPKASFNWSNLSAAKRDAILGFLRERGGVKPFLFQSPHESIQRKWRCKSWKVTAWQNGDIHSVSATFEAQP